MSVVGAEWDGVICPASVAAAANTAAAWPGPSTARGSTADGRIWSTPQEFPTPAAESYPHDIELKGKLYIAHLAGGKHNGNNIYLAIVGLVDVSF